MFKKLEVCAYSGGDFVEEKDYIIYCVDDIINVYNYIKRTILSGKADDIDVYERLPNEGGRRGFIEVKGGALRYLGCYLFCRQTYARHDYLGYNLSRILRKKRLNKGATWASDLAYLMQEKEEITKTTGSALFNALNDLLEN